MYHYYFVFVFQVIKKFRDDELAHHDTGLEHDAEKVLDFKILTVIT